MMDKQAIVKDMLHFLEYDKEYSDLAGYVPAIKAILKDSEQKQALENELREVKKSYLQTIEKMKSYQKRNKQHKAVLEQIKLIANGREVKG
jgi:hypothetical protein